jgi:integrase/recombinase XerD
MMAKYKHKKPQNVADRLRWLIPHVEGFTAQLRQSGYSAATITELTRLLACWAEWMRNAGFDIDSIETGFAASAKVFRGGRTARAPQGAAALFVTYLRHHGVLPPPVRPARPEEIWPILAAFRNWMREQRGVADSTLDTYQSTLTDLLAALGDDPAAYTAAAIRGFVLDRVRIPMKPAMHSNLKPATRSDLKPAIVPI